MLTLALQRTTICAFLLVFILSCNSKPQYKLDSDEDTVRSVQTVELGNLLDWKAYLTKKGLPQSAAFENENLYYQPKAQGFYYQYFYFEDLPKNALEVISYIKGNRVGRFLEQDEAFLALKMKAADPDLQLLDMVGKSLTAVEEILGSPQMERSRQLIYWDGEYALQLFFNSKNEVEAFHYLKTAQKIKTLAELWTQLNQQ
jgi:hypothetical protein